MKLKDITSAIEELAPPAYQEDYDNAGLLTGSPDMEVTGALFCVDVTDEVLDEALETGANLVVSHHPLVFRPLKKLTGATRVERLLLKAVRNGLALYAAHTNLDSVEGGVSFAMADRLGLRNVRVLSPRENDLVKIAVYTPEAYADKVREALAQAGAGHIGKYDACSFNVCGEGTFRAGDGARPFVGEPGVLHREREVRTETIVPRHRLRAAVEAMRRVHPYEEAAYDLYPLANPNPSVGFGAVGDLEREEPLADFLQRVKKVFGAEAVRYSQPDRETVRKGALCGGSGGSLLEEAVRSGADVYLTADVKYDLFYAARGRIVLADIGHFESEYFAIDILYDTVTKKFPNFAACKSTKSINPINYLV